ncbi:hypothetical protein J3E72DRAFT_429954 [Bipolaris maydis]|nr:hypothetical protein J3E73DRAFT_228891 [Bipolaris maydis]KAJ5062324.1 hypothetical protein J3E74DRAFT_446920 [Bipolaris maydis]KAJ6191748.1 hypothetical protein J3E72DRAFT_254294 [Bipolaris maydis]KAJ6198601.1 hypothetical protein J3E72DRAFT_429954 [Bipolaris maydis]KAJ6204495.1 hypothetical protein PSV09DRAFT_2385404 [Bipolaris maydis]
MAPSPRKRATPTAKTTLFNTTWNDSDAALFDPSTLPVAKIPRAWERKQEIKRIGHGKEKKIWRRFNLRSRVDNTPQDDADDEEQDALSRPVKRRQHISPKAMEKTSTRPNAKKRAFKATRWDRRKSVLPRKRATPFADNEPTGDDEGEDHSYDLTESDVTSFNEPDEAMQGQEEAFMSPVDAHKTPALAFNLDTATTDDLPDRESLDEHQDMEQDTDSRSTDDTTLANLFRSPAKVSYPELPQIGAIEGESETGIEDIAEQPEENANVDKIKLQDQDSHSIDQTPESLTEIQYPTLPTNDTKSSSPPPSHKEDQATTKDNPEAALPTDSGAENPGDDVEEDDTPSLSEERDPEEEFTEASLQLDILRDYQKTMLETSAMTTSGDDSLSEKVQAHQITEGDSEDDSMDDEASPTADEAATDSDSVTSEDHAMDEAPTEDITDGLALSLSTSKPASPTPRKLHSPPPRLASGFEDTTVTVAFDDDTAMLKDFLNRAAASKAEKAAITTHRRESLQNRRDSDVVRHALASPRKALEEKDPNSPAKHNIDLTLDFSQTPTLSAPSEALPSPTPAATGPEDADETNEKTTRRSSRAKKSRLPAPASTGPAPAPKIAIRRNDGNEVVVLKKDDAKVLADLTRANTRKNKQGAFCVTVRLMKAQMDAMTLPPINETPKEIVIGKNVRWDEQLAYYQENPDTIANALAEAESLATPDELSFSDTGSEPKKKKKEKTSKTSTPKIRRVRGLGTANGTPAKGLTAPSSLLPESVLEEKETSQDKPTQQKHPQIPKPKVAKAKKMPVAPTSIDSSVSSSVSETKLPSLDVAPVGVPSSSLPTQRKSRLAAPKKVILPQLTGSVEKENSIRAAGLTDATPKKGIPAPKVMVGHSGIATPTSTGMESGLPRRRGKKH